MRFGRKLRQGGEAALVVVGLATIPYLPRWAVVRLARGLGTLGYYLDLRDRRIGLANVAAALGSSLDARQRKEIVRQTFQNFVLVALDLFWFRAFTKRRIARWVQLDSSFELWRQMRPCIAVTAHFGNWEVMGQAAAQHGAPSVSVVANFENPAVRRILDSSRQATGQRTEIREGAVKGLLQALRGGGRVALVMDQNTPPAKGGVFVPFFGLPVAMPRTPASLWKRTGAPIVHGSCVADARGAYTVYVSLLVGGDEQSLSEEDVLRRVAGALERAVRAQPGQWLWTYKRWKYVPAGADPNRYPFYARQFRAAAPREPSEQQISTNRETV